VPNQPSRPNGPHTVDLRIPFVGRREELAALDAALDASEAVTLVGTGGVGKSRLAIEAAQRWERRTGGTAIFVALTWVEPPAVADAIARALDVRDEPGVDPLEAIAAALHAEPRALILDNCEDAAPAVAAAVERLRGIAGAPILATSRSQLLAQGERVVAVQTFDARDGGAFFAARARNADIAVDLEGADAPAVDRIVASLDGLAIAIDLAAARLASLTVRELADELAQPRPYHFRSSGSSEPRHWTLNHVVDWSVEKLDERSANLFALVSRFAGAFTEEDAAALEGDSAPAEGALAVLAHQSLIAAGPRPGDYSMLAPIRAVAARRRAKLLDRRAVDERFARRMNDLAVDLSEKVEAANQPGARAMVVARYEDFAEALSWALKAPGDRLKVAIDIFHLLVTVWADGGRFTEGLRWSERVQAAAGALDRRSRGRVWYSALRIAYAASEYDRMLALGPQLITTFTIVNDRLGLARAYNGLAVASHATGRFDESQTYVDIAFALYESLGHERGMAAALVNQGNIALEGRLDPVTARDRYERALEIMKRSASDALTAVVYGNLAEAASDLHDPAGVERYARAALDLLASTGDLARTAWNLHSIARARLARNDVGSARTELCRALELLDQQRHPGYLALCVETAARLLAGERAHHAAATLVYAARRLRKERRVPPIGSALVEASALMARLESLMTPPEHERALAEAAAVDLRQLGAIARRSLAV
jgi:predicted ATPase